MTESPAKSPRRRRPPPAPGRAWLGTFLLLNILPVVGLAVTGILWKQGKIQLRELPKGLTANLVAFGVGVAALGIVASLSLPVAHGMTSALERLWRRGLHVFVGRLPGSRLLAVLRMPVVAVGWMLAWLSRAILILLALALIGLCLVFLVRLFQPEFAEPLARRVLGLAR